VHLGLIAVVVKDYDPATNFFVSALRPPAVNIFDGPDSLLDGARTTEFGNDWCQRSDDA
jgi:hypothetical protein